MVSACGARYEAGWDAENHKTTTGSKTKTKQTTKKHMCRHFCLRLRLRLCVRLRLQFARPSGQRRVRSPLSLVILIFMGSPPLSPMVDIWGINVKHRNQSPSNHDHSYGPGVLPPIGPFGGASHHMPLNYNSESNNDIKHTRVGSKVRSKYCSHTRSRSSIHYKRQCF